MGLYVSPAINFIKNDSENVDSKSKMGVLVFDIAKGASFGVGRLGVDLQPLPELFFVNGLSAGTTRRVGISGCYSQ